MNSSYLDEVLKAFSGYVVVDELYEGPYCVLFAVDNRQDKRLLYEVLDHDAKAEDVEALLFRLKTALAARSLSLKGITTDGSALYPEAIKKVFGAVPHQVCRFHVIAELVKGVLKAVAAERKKLAASAPKLKRGRPSTKDKQAQRLAQQSKQIKQKISDLYRDRFLFVKRRMSPAEHTRLLFITRSLPQLRKLRQVMDQVYTLFDRRCRCHTAVAKLATLGAGLKRVSWLKESLKKIFSPQFEQALTYLDDKLLPSTSNAVERANRRHRKMQKSVYRVRSQDRLVDRIALDMFRDVYTPEREQTIQALHDARRGFT